jgi:hypothetical protein
MLKIVNRVGEKHITNEGYEIEIIEYFSRINCTIQFEDKTIIKNKRYNEIKEGKIKNPHHKSVHGVGFVGIGKYKVSFKNIHTKYYTCWRGMLERCYCKKFHSKKPTYIGCSVADDWHNFQNFAKWFDENYNPETMQGWQLDKDILVKGNKIYSSETCCFVPNNINALFTKSNSSRGKYPIGVCKCINGKYLAQITKNSKQTGIGYYSTIEEAFQVYRVAKEKYIKEVANKWKGLITDKVYEALINYQVEITD